MIDFDTVRAAWSDLIPPLNLPRGVHEFRSIEGLNALKKRCGIERIARIRAESREG